MIFLLKLCLRSEQQIQDCLAVLITQPVYHLYIWSHTIPWLHLCESRWSSLMKDIMPCSLESFTASLCAQAIPYYFILADTPGFNCFPYLKSDPWKLPEDHFYSFCWCRLLWVHYREQYERFNFFNFILWDFVRAFAHTNDLQDSLSLIMALYTHRHFSGSSPQCQPTRPWIFVAKSYPLQLSQQCGGSTIASLK